MNLVTDTGQIGVVTDAMRESEERATKEEAKSLGLMYVDLRYINYNPDIAELVSWDLCDQSFTLPFMRKGKQVGLATRDVKKAKVLVDELEKQKFKIDLAYASKSSIAEALVKLKDASSVIARDEITTFVDTGLLIDDIKSLGQLKKSLEGVSSKQMLVNILNGATKIRASDIHIEPYKGYAVLRYRIDGVMEEMLRLDNDQNGELTKQLKYQAGLVLNRSNIPQDGRFEFTTVRHDRQGIINARVSIMPTVYGESIVIRLLDQGDVLLGLDEIGMSKITLAFIKQAIHETKGMILITGPTGSGKTSTLYAIINHINDGEKKIITLEDPVEYRVEGIVQSQVDHDNNYNFADGLRAILRHDPDVILVGEIRDEETAKIATQACLTGHLVLATIHTNSPVATITRLRNFGIEEYNIAPAMNLILAQRLVRKICTNCTQTRDVNSQELLFLQVNGADDIKQVKEGKGCDKCNNTGFLGRIGLFAPLPITPTLKASILNHETEAQIENRIKNAKLPTLQTSAFDMVREGITSLSEVIRVIGMG